MRATYLHGLDVIGAPADSPETNRAILIRVKNAGELARSQGTLATVAQSLAPATIESKVYDEMAKQLQQKFKEQHVDADVTIVEPRGYQSADGGKHIWQDVAIGIGLAGAIALAWGLVSSGRHIAGRR